MTPELDAIALAAARRVRDRFDGTDSIGDVLEDLHLEIGAVLTPVGHDSAELDQAELARYAAEIVDGTLPT